MATTNDGGPAFPVQDAASWQGHGMTLRDYFAAHAPAEPQPWFTPVMPPMPKPDPAWKLCGVCCGGGECLGWTPCDKAKIVAFNAADNEWQSDQIKQRYVQWPYAWADALLAVREAQTHAAGQINKELLAAAKKVLANLNERIADAPSDSVPVFVGIADLHDAINKAEGR